MDLTRHIIHLSYHYDEQIKSDKKTEGIKNNIKYSIRID